VLAASPEQEEEKEEEEEEAGYCGTIEVADLFSLRRPEVGYSTAVAVTV
jgi:hypothetical protein